MTKRVFCPIYIYKFKQFAAEEESLPLWTICPYIGSHILSPYWDIEWHFSRYPSESLPDEVYSPPLYAIIRANGIYCPQFFTFIGYDSKLSQIVTISIHGYIRWWQEQWIYQACKTWQIHWLTLPLLRRCNFCQDNIILFPTVYSGINQAKI